MKLFLACFIFGILFFPGGILNADARGYGYLPMDEAEFRVRETMEPGESIEQCYRRHVRRVACKVRMHGVLEITNEDTGEVVYEDLIYTVRVWMKRGQVFVDNPWS